MQIINTIFCSVPFERLVVHKQHVAFAGMPERFVKFILFPSYRCRFPEGLLFHRCSKFCPFNPFIMDSFNCLGCFLFNTDFQTITLVWSTFSGNYIFLFRAAIECLSRDVLIVLHSIHTFVLLIMFVILFL